MGDNLQQATIKIEEVIDQEKLVKIKASGRTYNVFKKKKDNSSSVAYKQISDMDLKAGMTVDIGYNDSNYTNNQGKQVISHNIAFFREPSIQVDNEQPTVNHGYDGDGARQGMAIKAGIDMFIAGKTDDWRKTANEVYNFTPTKDTSTEVNVNGDDINVEDLPF